MYENPLEPLTVPKELCIPNPKCVEAYERAWTSNVFAIDVIRSYESKYEFLRFASELRSKLWLEEDKDLSIENQQVLIELRKKYDSVISNFLSSYENQSASISRYRKDHGDQPYAITTFRNQALKEVAEIYHKEGIELIPILLTPNEFDILFGTTQEGSSQTSRSLEICMDFIPVIDEGKLAWEQVIEFRQDKEARQKLLRLRRWFNLELANMSENRIKDTISKRLDDYKWALQKHGIETLIGGFTSVATFFSGPQLIAMLSASPLAIAGGGVAVGAGALVWITNKYIQKLEIERSEVAYIYEVNKFGNPRT
jgi:hypothetical protein